MTSPGHRAPAEVTPAYRARTIRDPAGQRLRRDERANPGTSTSSTLAARLTGRDRWLLGMLAEHRVLTTGQIAQLAFGSRRQATGRLRILHQLRAVDRFRPYTAVGSAPLHYVLAPLGARVVAADHGTTIEALPHRPENLARLAISMQLAHDVGANGVFTSLAAHARTAGAGGELTVWWSEARCLATWDGVVRPDGYGRWRPATGPGAGQRAGHRGETDFFLEYDAGTENLDRIVAKLAGYARLATASGLVTPILFWLPHPRRELAVHRAARAWLHANLALAGHLPIATSHAGLAEPGPAGPVWLKLREAGAARPSSMRLTLAQLGPPTLDLPAAHRATVEGPLGPALEVSQRLVPEASAAGTVAAWVEAPVPRPPRDPRRFGTTPAHEPAPGPVAWNA